MRRDIRRKKNQEDDLTIKIIKYAGIGLAVLTLIVFAFLIYSKNLNDEVRRETLAEEQISSIFNNSNVEENTLITSTEIGKSVNEASNEALNVILENDEEKKNVIDTTNNFLTTENVKPTSNASSKNNEIKKEEEEKKVELNFEKPVEGEIVKDFAEEKLIYSNTLQEWTTHTGVDIKAEKTAVVNVAEAGTVKTIKNDPRYGLTVIVEHENGYQTVYSNLLTSEFVVEGEKLEKGQAIGTVGNTAAFEIADEPHLHFEIIKDGNKVDPSIYIK